MKRIMILLLILSMWSACKEKPQIDTTYVVEKFKQQAAFIEKLEYRIQRIDTFANGPVWNHTGTALIEKDKSDNLLGFSFYGKRDDVPKAYLYDKGIQFQISDSTKTYKTDKGSGAIMGSPGGQMIPQNLFQLDSVYKSRTLTETEDSYILKYEFKDDTVYNITDIIKTVELTKDSYMPVKITRTSKMLGHRSFTQTVLSDVKINEQVPHSIKEYKSKFEDYEIIQQEATRPNPLLNQPVPALSLPDLSAQNKTVNISTGKLTLIDFWEPWCGPCIASFPKVEMLKKKYPSLHIVGISSEDSAAALRLVHKKETTFLNLIGNKELLEKFNVHGWPSYFLVDQKGIVRKEYGEFSDQIEKDIKEMIN